MCTSAERIAATPIAATQYQTGTRSRSL
jgi:hypothetical protein